MWRPWIAEQGRSIEYDEEVRRQSGGRGIEGTGVVSSKDLKSLKDFLDSYGRQQPPFFFFGKKMT